jgi:hypothetical protein
VVTDVVVSVVILSPHASPASTGESAADERLGQARPVGAQDSRRSIVDAAAGPVEAAHRDDEQDVGLRRILGLSLGVKGAGKQRH